MVLERARRAFDLGQFKAAAAELDAARPNCPADRAKVDLALGQVQYLLGQDADAESSFQSALAIDPKNQDALYALGRLYSMQNRFPAAVEKFEAAVLLNPKNFKVWDNLGVCYDALGRDRDSLHAFFKALDLVQRDHPTYDWAHANLADFFLRRDQNEKAFQLAVEAATRNPDSARNSYLAGKALVRLEKYDLSLRWLERAVSLDEHFADALYMLMQTYQRLGREAEAARTRDRFKEASKTRPRR
jgi:tetratricopeptide (TPR) repeat protein